MKKTEKQSGKHPETFPALDNDLAGENMEDHFDMTLADLQDLEAAEL